MLGTAPLPIAEGGPTVQLLEAGNEDADDARLHERARLLADAAKAAHTSRSYRHPYALLAWHDHPVGIDIERIEPVDRAFLESISTPSERVSLRVRNEAADVISLWCSKEALAKALGDARRYDPRRLESPVRWPEGRSGPWRARRLEAPAGYLAWVCWRSS